MIFSIPLVERPLQYIQESNLDVICTNAVLSFSRNNSHKDKFLLKYQNYQTFLQDSCLFSMPDKPIKKNSQRVSIEVSLCDVHLCLPFLYLSTIFAILSPI